MLYISIISQIYKFECKQKNLIRKIEDYSA